ncbi:MAG TPA: serine hydrolase domain-containing protein [Chitinophagaceae bacterium]|nr:serine hydrolase domain-containing protein [Chitinophagaceae bacterium]
MSQHFNSICRKYSLVTYFMLLCLVSFGQYDFSNLDKKFNEAKKELGKNTVILIYKDGKIIYKKESDDFKANSPAQIASCSKWLTAALVMTFVDEGKISLDDKVSTYLPIFAKYGKSFITIRNCLSHETGIKQEHVNLLSIMDKKKFASLEEEVNDFASKKEIDFNPGTGFYYGGIGLNIAARVLEVITRKKFDQLMNERILRPLAMRNTSFFSEKAINPSGGATSAAIDYINFLSMILNKGMFKDKRILSEKAIEEMQKSETVNIPIKYTPKTAEGFNYGLGEWIEEADENGKSIVVSCPGLFGTWPWVDNCRGYACIIFTKSIISEHKKEVYSDLRKTIEEIIPSTCK